MQQAAAPPLSFTNNQRKQTDSSVHMHQTPIWNILYFLSPQSLMEGDNRYYKLSAQAHLLARWKFCAKDVDNSIPTISFSDLLVQYNNHQRILQPLQLCFLFITTGMWIYGLRKALELWLTDWESFYFINTTWFNKQEIRKLILRNEPPESIFQPEDNHANKSEVILLALLRTDAHVLL